MIATPSDWFIYSFVTERGVLYRWYLTSRARARNGTREAATRIRRVVKILIARPASVCNAIIPPARCRQCRRGDDSRNYHRLTLRRARFPRGGNSPDARVNFICYCGWDSSKTVWLKAWHNAQDEKPERKGELAISMVKTDTLCGAA